MKRQRKPIDIRRPARSRALEPVPERRGRRVRQVHRATDHLSAGAGNILRRGVAANKSAAAIAAELLAFGEPVPERTISRRALEFRAEANRRLTMAALNQELLASGLWRPEELIALVDKATDIRPGWSLRRKRGISRLLKRFCANPNRELLRAIEGELFSFWLSFVVSKTPFSYTPANEPSGDPK